MESSTVTYLDELRLRGEAPIRARTTMVLAGLVADLSGRALHGQKPELLNHQVVAGAMLALEQAELYQAGPVVVHLRMALALMTIKQNGPIVQPISASHLQRWVKANGFWPEIKAELARQQQLMLAQVNKMQSSVD